MPVCTLLLASEIDFVRILEDAERSAYLPCKVV